MTETYAKLFGSITDSTIWTEDNETRIVWITMLAMADRRGYVGASLPGLAARSRVPLEATKAALVKFLQPDPYSRSADYEGRRIKAVDRGWVLLNFERFRDMRDEEARKEYERHRKRDYRDQKRRANECPNVSPDVPDKSQMSHKSPHIHSHSHKQKLQSKKKKTPPPPFELDSSVNSPEVRTALADWIAYRKQRKPALTAMTIDRLPRRILKMGAAQFIAAVAHTIDQGWQGLREPEGQPASPHIPLAERMENLEVDRD